MADHRNADECFDRLLGRLVDEARKTGRNEVIGKIEEWLASGTPDGRPALASVPALREFLESLR